MKSFLSILLIAISFTVSAQRVKARTTLALTKDVDSLQVIIRERDSTIELQQINIDSLNSKMTDIMFTIKSIQDTQASYEYIDFMWPYFNKTYMPAVNGRPPYVRISPNPIFFLLK